MLELKGKYGDAKVFTDNIDQETISQVIGLLNQPYAAESKIRIMPDCFRNLCNMHNDFAAVSALCTTFRLLCLFVTHI